MDMEHIVSHVVKRFTRNGLKIIEKHTGLLKENINTLKQAIKYLEKV